MKVRIEMMEIDPEWLDLIDQARQIGLSIDEVKAFIDPGTIENPSNKEPDI